MLPQVIRKASKITRPDPDGLVITEKLRMASLINRLFGSWDPLDCELVKLMAEFPPDIDCCPNCHKGGKNAHVTTVTLHLKEMAQVKVCCGVADYFYARSLLN